MKNLTTREDPPQSAPTRISVWTAITSECRNDSGNWRRVNRKFKSKNSAQQLASNIRSSHRRTKQFTGTLPGEVWESTWAATKDGSFAVWLRHIGPSETTSSD